MVRLLDDRRKKIKSDMSKSTLSTNNVVKESDLNKSEFTKSKEEKELLKKLKAEWKAKQKKNQ